MIFRIAADAVLILHVIFIFFALFGGLLAMRRLWLLITHLIALAWAIGIAITGSICPLTPLENMLRRMAGSEGYQGGFVEHYLLPLIYPAGLTPMVQFVLASALLTVNLVVYSLVIWRRRYPH